MERQIIKPRADFKKKVLDLGLSYFLGGDAPYWNEGACYQFTEAEIDEIEAATQELHVMCLEAVDYVIRNKFYTMFGIPAAFAPYIEASWKRADPFIYGRFDLSYDGVNPPKMLEYNADTPTSLPEAAVAQWYWLEDQKAAGVLPAAADQFNSIHESLIAAWQRVATEVTAPDTIHFAAYLASKNGVPMIEEDHVNLEYMRDVCTQAGFNTAKIDICEIGWNGVDFTDKQEKPIRALYKLYPWEMLAQEEFGALLPRDRMGMIEPPWKMILSNKTILAVLWKMFPNHPNLLPAYLVDGILTDNYVRKPILGREGSNVLIVENGISTGTHGIYDNGHYVYQALHKLPDFDGHHPVIGAWVTGEHQSPAYGLSTHPRGGRACGIGIREGGLVTDNASRFVPHYFTPSPC